MPHANHDPTEQERTAGPDAQHAESGPGPDGLGPDVAPSGPIRPVTRLAGIAKDMPSRAMVAP